MVGTFGTDAEREQFKSRIRDQYESQGSPYYSTARLWDDGIIDPIDTRAVLALGLAAARHVVIKEPGYGVFRM
jgi:3-methylcrotonyl-CoA carboxylase beta subunit